MTAGHDPSADSGPVATLVHYSSRDRRVYLSLPREGTSDPLVAVPQWAARDDPSRLRERFLAAGVDLGERDVLEVQRLLREVVPGPE